MTVRVHLMPTEHPDKIWSSDVVTVEAANAYTTNATGGAGLLTDLYDKDPNKNGVRLATFGHVLYVEIVQDTIQMPSVAWSTANADVDASVDLGAQHRLNLCIVSGDGHQTGKTVGECEKYIRTTENGGGVGQWLVRVKADHRAARQE